MGRDRDGDLGAQTREQGVGPVSLPRAPPLSPHPVNCAESAQGEEQRGSGHGPEVRREAREPLPDHAGVRRRRRVLDEGELS